MILFQKNFNLTLLLFTINYKLIHLNFIKFTIYQQKQNINKHSSLPIRSFLYTSQSKYKQNLYNKITLMLNITKLKLLNKINNCNNPFFTIFTPTNLF